MTLQNLKTYQERESGQEAEYRRHTAGVGALSKKHFLLTGWRGDGGARLDRYKSASLSFTHDSQHTFKIQTFWIDVKRKKKAGQSDVATMDKIAPDDLQAEDFDMSGLDIRAMDVDEDVKTLIIEKSSASKTNSSAKEDERGVKLSQLEGGKSEYRKKLEAFKEGCDKDEKFHKAVLTCLPKGVDVDAKKFV
ncbi:unnamed protein product [Symbiodinium natans]|uniref:Uncharacterized protein n=1 Tax=Symbiodinium natans TaxID=878477 RepID=A0A812TPW4_9DINO|nr:unnamed protein product [Symbiodinium natans]